MMGASATYPKLARGAALAALCLLALGGCTDKDKRVRFDGIHFKTKAKAVDRKVSAADFQVEVKKATQSLDGARGAGEYAGIRYCIANFGSSRIDWAIGPDTDPAVLRIEGDTLTFRGTCLKP
ncbi:hypothetical protein [Aquicoccus sp. SU-CL01552]|uniref:hypothetical protein n=1 Tax=Aquicoccus sp. SU-CL01552 TaxID=3127656 RepID=UPI0033402901